MYRTRINIDYIKSIIFVACSSAAYMFGFYLFRRFSQYNLDIALFNFIKSCIQSLIIYVYILYINNFQFTKTKNALYTRYSWFYILKSVIFVIGATLWSKGVLANGAHTPMYIVTYISFASPVILRLLSCILLNYSWKRNIDIILICTISYLPILIYIHDKFFSYEIMLMFLGYVAWSIVDFMNEMTLVQHHSGLLNKVASSFSNYNDPFMTCLFNTVSAGIITFGIQVLYNFGFNGCKWINELKILSSMATLDLTFYICSSVLSLIGLYCMSSAFALKGASSAQTLKAFEPIIVGIILNLQSLPIEIIIGAIIFFIGSVYAVMYDARTITPCIEDKNNTRSYNELPEYDDQKILALPHHTSNV